MNKVFANKKLIGVGLAFLIALGLMIRLHLMVMQLPVPDKEDIYYSWVEGQRILSGENPYARVLTGNMVQNQKYATYFPAFYWLSAASQVIGLHDFPEWIAFWRVIFLAFDMGIAVLLFLTLDRYRYALLGIFAACFWLFNRWTLIVLNIADLDFIPIFFLLWSLLLLPKHQRASLVLFSLSLAIKQIAIFLVPLYLLWVWQTSDREQIQNRIRRVLLATVIIFSIPFLTALPFLIWNAEGFIKSIAFSVTRESSASVGGPSVSEWLNLTGIPARVPLIALLLLVYASMLQRRISIYVGALLALAVFVNFNPVLFRQYVPWLLPFVPLVVCDVKDRLDNNRENKEADITQSTITIGSDELPLLKG